MKLGNIFCRSLIFMASTSISACQNPWIKNPSSLLHMCSWWREKGNSSLLWLFFIKNAEQGEVSQDFYLRFSKLNPLLQIWYIFMSLITKNRQNFHFQKITGTLKCIFLHLQIPSFCKEQLAKSKSEIKNCILFYA